MKRLIAILFFIFASSIIAQEVSANATRPSASDNAYLTEYGYTELELGWYTIEDFWSVPALLKFTFAKDFELGFLMNGIVDHSEFGNISETDVGDPGIQLKAQIYEGPMMAIALLGRADFLHNDLQRFTAYSAWSFQREMFQLDATVGGVFHSDKFPGSNSFIYAVSLAPKLEGDTGFYVEIFGEQNEVLKPVYFDAGVSYAVSPRFVLDAAYFAGLNDHAVDWQVHVGFTATLFQIFESRRMSF